MKRFAAPFTWVTQDGLNAVAIVFGFLAVYLLTFSGQLHSIDEVALFGMTERWAQAGEFGSTLTRFAPYHNQVGTLEPGYALLAAPLYTLGRVWLGVSTLHVTMLLNPLLTAITGGVLFGLGRHLGYAPGQSLGLALAFGLGSMAWPYTKSFLREPAVGLFWVIMLWGLADFVRHPTRWSAALTSAGAVLAAGVKFSSLAVWPVVLGFMLWGLYRERRLSARWVLVGGVASLGLSMLLGLWLLSQRGFGTSGLLASFFINPFSVAGLTPWYGLLLSPGKSVVVYSPVLVLSLVGAHPFYRRHGRLAIGLLLMWGAVLLVLRSTQWWGGITWGPRFLLPLLPLALLPALEVLKRPWAWGVLALSCVYQFFAATADWSRVYNTLFSYYSDTTLGLDWAHWADSPAFKLLALWGRSTLDLVWLHTGLADEIKFDSVLVSVLLVALSLTAMGAGMVWAGKRWALMLSSLAVLLAVPSLLIRAYGALPDYPGLSAPLARQLAARMTSGIEAPTQLFYVSPDVYTYPWLGLLKGSVRATWFSPAETEATFEAALIPDSERVVVVVDRPHIASHYPGDNLVTWMNERAYRLSMDWFDSYEVFFYVVASDRLFMTTALVVWPTGVQLEAWAASPILTRNAYHTVALQFACLNADGPRPDELFTNLIGPDGVTLTGQQGLLRGACRGGQSLIDRRAFWLPPDAPAGEYSLVVGFADAQGFVPARFDNQTDDYVALTFWILP